MQDLSNARAAARRPPHVAPKPPEATWGGRDEFRARMGLGEPLTPELQQRRDAEIFNMTRDRLIKEYRTYGLDPVFADEDRTIVVSLAMLRSMGWVIKVVGRNQFELCEPVGKKRAKR